LKEENVSIRKRLFFTATPKHYDLKHRNKDGDFKVVSMDDEAVYGKRIHTLTFGEAASAGIICPYKVVVTLIDKEQVDDFALKNGITLVEGDAINAKWVANQIAISNAIEHTSASKVITFHSRVKTAREFASDESHGVKQFLKDFSVFHVHGKQRSNDRKDLITKFRNAEKSLITNARCLTEGIDVPAVDMVAFIDPRQSKIDIAQAIGRAMRKPRNGTKTHGYIVVPVYAENSDTASLEEAIKGEGFDSIALILGALLEQDEELVDIIRELKQDRGEGKPFNPQRLKERVELIGPYLQLETLTKSVNLSVLDRLGLAWDEWYGRLQNFRAIEGHSLVPVDKTWNGYAIGRWVAKQRQKRLVLSSDRIAKLDAVDFIWSPRQDNWEVGYQYLKSFRQREGHCRVPLDHIESGYHLGRMVAKQRGRRVKLSSARKKLLDDLGFSWEPHLEQWEANIAALQKFWLREKHCDVPQAHIEGTLKLGLWVATQRLKKSDLTANQISSLTTLGFVWDPRSARWDKFYMALQQFAQREGHSDVPRGHIEGGCKLGEWVQIQRARSQHLSTEQLRLLKIVNFVLKPHDKLWEESYGALVAFRKREGHCRVPDGHKEAGVNLGNWVGKQRAKAANLTDDRRGRLDALGFIWNARSAD
jgi:hypothetical protein